MKRIFSKAITALKREEGLTLIDLSILLIITAFLMLPIIKQVENHYTLERNGHTDANISAIDTALQQYYERNGRFPCPADLSKTTQDIDYGKEVPGCHLVGAPGDPASGGVPFQDLRIPVGASLDGYKNKITYHVSKGITQPTQVPTGTIQYNVLIYDEFAPPPYLVPRTDPMLYVLVSHGRNGMGTTGADGTALIAPCVVGTLDEENCNGDNLFLDEEFRGSTLAGANYFDDRVRGQDSASDKPWNVLSSVDAEIFSNKAVNIGIGTNSPKETVHVDVIGDILTSSSGNLAANKYCDDLPVDPVTGPAPPECFSTDLIAGNTTDCTSDLSGPLMTGIEYGARKCGDGGNIANIVATTPALTATDCGAMGKFITAIDASGNITCGP